MLGKPKPQLSPGAAGESMGNAIAAMACRLLFSPRGRGCEDDIPECPCPHRLCVEEALGP